ncbi:hypothetical protein HK101_009599 [Irineochytrium annulatum]|nr:hypothetical protein HK101_009599 [Irineochytrium annulatum]
MSGGRGKGGKGLGKGGAKRHRKILRDNIQGITKPAIRRLARRGGVKRISGLIYEETRGVLKVFLENVIRDAVTYTEHAKRKTVTSLDVVYALKRQGRTIYGFGAATVMQLAHPSGDDGHHPTHKDPSTIPLHPIPTPESPDSYCNVRALLAGRFSVDRRLFVDQSTREIVTVPCYAFLLTHASTGQTFMFDLGLRRDCREAPPKVVKSLPTFDPRPPHVDVAEILSENGVDTAKVACVAISHPHFDHWGDPATWPRNVPFMLGGERGADALRPGYPDDEGSTVYKAQLDGKYWVSLFNEARSRVSQRRKGLERVGAFEHCLDYFSDGSLWLVDAPGHCEGHMMAMVRTSCGDVKTGEEPTYVVLTGDAAHEACLYMMGDDAAKGADKRRAFGRFGGDIYSPDPDKGRGSTVHADEEVAYDTVARLARMDALENVFVIGAHDVELDGLLPVFPNDKLGEAEVGVNCWKKNGWKEERSRRADARRRD